MPIHHFGSIIVYNSNQYTFVCHTLHTECFVLHFHAYEVSRISNVVFCTHSDLVDPTLLCIASNLTPIISYLSNITL